MGSTALPIIAVALLVASIAGSASAAPTTLSLEFGTPSKIVGSVQASGLSWALVIFAPAGAEANFELDGLSSVVQRNHVGVQNDEMSPVLEESSMVPPYFYEDGQEHPSRVEGEATFGTDYTSLLVEAESISLNMRAAAYIRTPGEGDEMSSFLPEAYFPAGTYRNTPDVAQDSVAVGFLPDGTNLVLAAQGVHRIEWFGAAPRCPDYCPPGGGKATAFDGGDARVETYSYVELQAATGALTATGTPATVAVGGHGFNLAADGFFHFPQVKMDGRCKEQACPETDGETLRINGSLELQGLHQAPSDKSRVATTASGHVLAASLDETPFTALTAQRTAAAAAVVVGLVVVWKLALAFFARNNLRSLDRPRVREVYDLIAARPGLMFTEIKRVLSRGDGSLARQLRMLLDDGEIVARRYRDTLRYYENHGRYDQVWMQHAALADDDLRRVYEWLVARPGKTQIQVLQGLPEWPRRTLAYKLRSLRNAGLVREVWQERRVHYFALPVPQPGSDAGDASGIASA